jgi:hypothetical protein
LIATHGIVYDRLPQLPGRAALKSDDPRPGRNSEVSHRAVNHAIIDGDILGELQSRVAIADDHLMTQE